MSLFFYVALDYAHAQLEFVKDGYEDRYFRNDEGPGAEKKDSKTAGKRSYIYESPTVQAFSYMFWGVNLYNTTNDWAIDHFLATNECELYRSYSTDELEWEEIRDATRDFINSNKSDFPSRFEFILPIKLKDYDPKKRSFQLQEEYEIISLRRFEFLADNYRHEECTYEISFDTTLPRAMVLEFSRPFTLTTVPMSEETAEAYIKEKSEIFRKKLKGNLRSKQFMYHLRDAFLVFKVKIFTHGKILGPNRSGVVSVQMLAILEGYEIYADAGREKLLYEQNYTTVKNNGGETAELKEQYVILRERSADKGILNY